MMISYHKGWAGRLHHGTFANKPIWSSTPTVETVSAALEVIHATTSAHLGNKRGQAPRKAHVRALLLASTGNLEVLRSRTESSEAPTGVMGSRATHVEVA